MRMSFELVCKVYGSYGAGKPVRHLPKPELEPQKFFRIRPTNDQLKTFAGEIIQDAQARAAKYSKQHNVEVVLSHLLLSTIGHRYYRTGRNSFPKESVRIDIHR